MGGTITEEQPPPKYDWPSARPVVFRYESGELKFLPNIQCDAIAQQEGPHAGHASFRYIFDSLVTALPTRIEQAQPTSSGKGVVRADDRLVVGTYSPSGKLIPLFDGFASIPEAGYSANGETVTFTAQATPIRCWDDVIRKTRRREASTPTNTAANKLTSLRCLFNPAGEGNKTAAGSEAHVRQGTTSTYRDYSIFLDTMATGVKRWSVASAVAYLLAEHNDEAYVKNPSLTELASLLDCWEPKTPDGEIDPADSSTYTSKPIAINDEDVTGKTWPEAVQDLIGRHGFVMRFELSADKNGLPTWRLRLGKSNEWARRQLKPLMLQAVGETLDISKSNVHSVRLAYDHGRIVNAYTCRSRPAEYEVSIMLAPMFTVSGGDTSSLEQFKTSAPSFDSVRNSYRLFGLDELGKGHWDFGTSATVTTIASLTNLLGGADRNASQWVQRARPPKRTLFSTDSAGRKRQATLDFILASAYSGPVPGVWDGSAASSFTAVKGGWRLLDDQCGIYIDTEDPSRFAFGDHSSARRGGVLSLVEAMNDSTKRIYFRLTCVIESDVTVDAEAKKRKASPTVFAVTRDIDGSSRFRPQVVSRYSKYGTASEDQLTRDDIDDQLLQAESRRFASEVPPFVGPIDIPFITNAYTIGDRITGVDGRGWTLTASASSASEDGSAAVLPRVVGVEWNFSDGERTTLHLSDIRVGRDYGL